MNDESPEASSWSKLDELFHRARRLNPPEREQLLSAQAVLDPALAKRLRAMLRHAEQPMLSTVGAAADRADPVGEAGQRCGAYRLLEPIGQGGMGSVWSAARDDEAFDERVAIKLLRGDYSDEASRRFRRERQLLARLRHPQVASLLDGGTTEEGRPFLVMELIDGRPIDEECERRAASVRERVQLFLPVCRAVAHAHGHLVVHRDLKPSNILLTASGSAKLLDFGVAALLEEEKEEGGEGPARRGRGRLLTPRYSSPEQLAGGESSVASDVYALGVVLYELLGGSSPYGGATTSIEELMEAVREGAIAPPSERGRFSRRELDADLDAIVLRCLERDPEARYGAVQALIADLESWLQGAPVQARQLGAFARGWRVVRAHRLASSALALGLLGLVGGMALSWQQARVARRAQQEEARQRALAESRAADVQEFARTTVFGLVQTSTESVPAAVRRQMLELGLDALQRLVEQAPDDPDLLREWAIAHSEMGSLLASHRIQGRGDPGSARVHLRRAVEIARRAVAARSDRDTRYALARCLDARAGELVLRGQHAAAEAPSREASELCATLADDQGRFAQRGWRALALLVENQLGQLLHLLGRAEEAERRCRAAEQGYRAWIDEGTAPGTARRELAEALCRRAFRAAGRGDAAPCIEHSEAALALVPARGDDGRGDRIRRRARTTLLRGLLISRRHAEARELLDTTLDAALAACRREPEAIPLRGDLVELQLLGSDLALRTERMLDALSLLDEALDGCDELVDSGLDEARAAALRLETRTRRLRCFLIEGQLEEAAEEQWEAVDALEALREIGGARAAGGVETMVWTLSALCFRDRLREGEERPRGELREAGLEALERARASVAPGDGTPEQQARWREIEEELRAGASEPPR